jgi:hypothetical protein
MSGVGQTSVYFGAKTGVNPTPIVLSDPLGPGGDFGSAVAGVGDVNGDGYCDLAVGSYGAVMQTGRVYLFAGGPNARLAETLTGPAGPSTFFGGAVAGVGDVNGDGYADFAVGAIDVMTQTGQAYVFLGSPGPAATPATTLTGPSTYAFFGCALAYAPGVPTTRRGGWREGRGT